MIMDQKQIQEVYQSIHLDVLVVNLLPIKRIIA